MAEPTAAPQAAPHPEHVPITGFSHLHTHSHYSLLNALPKIDDLVDTAKKYKMRALALTDNGNLYGAIDFYKACKKAEIKPIIGVDFYVAARKRTDMQAGVDSRRTRLVLLAKNSVGYHNLIMLVTKSHLDGFYYKPRIDRELLSHYHEGLICISPAMMSEVAGALRAKDTEKAKAALSFYRDTFGPEHVYQEITRHPELQGHDAFMRELAHFAAEQNVPIVAAQDVYYIEPDDKAARDTMLQVNTSQDASDRAGGGPEVEEDFSFISGARAKELFHDMPDALKNNARIAEACNLTLELGKWVFPDFKVESGRAPDEELRHVVYQGFARRNVPQSEDIVKRVEYELSVIKQKGYAPYFLVVADLLRFARQNGILSNIRGSVSGSMVTYLSGITNIDPLEYQIPFERFLNPERPSAPDIDMDYADDRRDEMVEYVRKKYGHDKVAQIGTFGTMAARGSVRDVARALGFSYDVGDRISKLIPMGAQGFPMTIDRAIDEVPELKELYTKDQDTKRIIDMAKKIEGCARHISIHAAGVVMAPTELTDFTALQYDPKGEKKIITQYDMYSIEEAGLLKFDFLGLKNLTIIANTVDLVKKLRGISIEMDTVPIDDKKTFEMLARGETSDLFQLNGAGMTKYLVELKPTSIHDINAMVALYRPGPIQFIPDYIARKHDRSLIKYLDPMLEQILEKTYGILVYQDDLLMMAHLLAGYSWGEVDKFRKAVGKKIPEEMAQQKDKFIKGCVKHSNWPQAKADELWTWIEPFAAYGFNKAHSVSYGRVAYQTAYLKANFPAEYMDAVLMSEAGDTERVAETVAECKRMGIPVLPPDINESYSQFTVIKGDAAGTTDDVRNDRIRFGLVTIKNFGQGIATAIIDERKRGGRFTSLANFLERVHDRNLNKKSLEALIKSGALDSLGERGQMLANMDLLLAYNKEHADKVENQDSLFGLMSAASTNGVNDLRMADAPAAPAKEKLAWEKELLGLYVSGHPLDRFRAAIEKEGTSITKALEAKEGASVLVVGVVHEIKPIATKKGDMMAFIKLEDFSGTIETVVFPKTYIALKEILKQDACVAVRGKLSERNGQKSVLIDKAKIIG